MIMHQSFLSMPVLPPPPPPKKKKKKKKKKKPTEMVGDGRAKVQANRWLGIVEPRCRPIRVCLSLQCRDFNTGTVISVILFFLLSHNCILIKDGTRAGLLPSACPHKAGLIPGSEK